MSTQGSQANAKDDTLYYALRGGAFANLATDLSQHADNQAAGASWTYEATPATRFNVTTTWTIEVYCDTDNNDTGYFLSYGAGGALLRLSLNGAGTVEAYLGASLLGSLALPGIGAAAEEFVIAWSCEPNALTTGAANALRSELRAWNVTDGTYSQTTFLHALRTSGTGDLVCWASSTAGANAFVGTARGIRISAGRFRTATETREDWIGATTAPTITGETRLESIVVEPGHELADPGAFAGPVLAQAAASARQNDLRTWSPTGHASYFERPALSGSTLSGAPTQWSRAASVATYTLLGAYVMRRRLPPRCTHVKVRANVQQWRTVAGTNDRLHLRAWIANRPPAPVAGVTDHDQSLTTKATTNATLATSHGSGAAAGEWVDFGLVEVVRNSAGWSWIMLGIRVEDLSGAVANNRMRVHALTVDPVIG